MLGAPACGLALMRTDLVAALFAASVMLQQPLPVAPRTGPDAPVNDPVTVRGCLDGRHLRILDHDTSDLSGIRDLRLKGPRGVMRALDDHKHSYVEITGELDLGRRDRIETRRKVKAGSKTTISIGASSEQVSGEPSVDDPTLQVEAFRPLGERCPGR
jgi:hypothetical protein